MRAPSITASTDGGIDDVARTVPPRAEILRASRNSDTPSKAMTVTSVGPVAPARTFEILYAGWYAPTYETNGSARTASAAEPPIRTMYAWFGV